MNLAELVQVEGVFKITHEWSNGHADFVFNDFFKIHSTTKTGRIKFTRSHGGVNGNDFTKQIEMPRTKTVTFETLMKEFREFESCICGIVKSSNYGFKKRR